MRSVFRLVGVSVFLTTMIFGYLVFVGQGVCRAVVESGALDCSFDSRRAYISGHPEIAVIFGIVSLIGGAFATLLLGTILDRNKS